MTQGTPQTLTLEERIDRIEHHMIDMMHYDKHQMERTTNIEKFVAQSGRAHGKTALFVGMLKGLALLQIGMIILFVTHLFVNHL